MVLHTQSRALGLAFSSAVTAGAGAAGAGAVVAHKTAPAAARIEEDAKIDATA
mgnify:CR=1 FL=1